MREFTDEDLAYASLIGWCGYIDPFWCAYAHLVLLCLELEDFAHAVARGETRKLMVFMPPQHGKSSVISRAFTSWLLGRWPHIRVILASYEASYAALWGRRSRDALTEHGERVFGVRVRQDSHAADHWELAKPHVGVLHTTGSTGGTGHPAEVVVIDDPVKGREEAESVAYREKTIEWYKGSIRTRRPRGQINVQTRWHEKDLAGWILENEPGEWKVINLPALAEEGDPLGRALGAPLCPELQSLAALLLERQVQGSYSWSSVYQQRPVPMGGGLFKRDTARRYKREGNWVTFADTGARHSLDTLQRFVTVDTATSDKTSADFTAVAAWGTTMGNGELVLLDLDMRRLEAPEIDTSIRTMCMKWRSTPWIEDSAPAKNLLSFLEVGTVGRDGRPRPGLAFKRVRVDTSKVARAIPASALMEQGRLVLPLEDAALFPWLAAYERQLFSFPNGEHDDAVDVTSMAAQVFALFGTGSPFGATTPVKTSREPDYREAFTIPKPPGW